VLNTSFNLKGEPIVNSPFDAIRTFYTSGLDALILDRYLIAKTPPSKETTSAEVIADAEPEFQQDHVNKILLF
jgi:hypothetical protein